MVSCLSRKSFTQNRVERSLNPDLGFATQICEPTRNWPETSIDHCASLNPVNPNWNFWLVEKYHSMYLVFMPNMTPLAPVGRYLSTTTSAALIRNAWKPAWPTSES